MTGKILEDVVCPSCTGRGPAGVNQQVQMEGQLMLDLDEKENPDVHG
jgi:hypothetical protein